jgi:hypothetical protein
LLAQLAALFQFHPEGPNEQDALLRSRHTVEDFFETWAPVSFPFRFEGIAALIDRFPNFRWRVAQRWQRRAHRP